MSDTILQQIAYCHKDGKLKSKSSEAQGLEPEKSIIPDQNIASPNKRLLSDR
jgi:hypothetical protein